MPSWFRVLCRRKMQSLVNDFQRRFTVSFFGMIAANCNDSLARQFSCCLKNPLKIPLAYVSPSEKKLFSKTIDNNMHEKLEKKLKYHKGLAKLLPADA